jgi:hypothetical protein|nr:MAG TPA: RBBP8 [Caudoviricetes sp.]
MFKVIASVAALVAGGACLGYAYAMDSVEEHLKKQGEYNKEIIDGLQNIVDELKKPVPVVEKDPSKKKGVLDIFDKD